MSAAEATRTDVVPLLLDATRAAALLGYSRRTFYRLEAQGLIPAPVSVGNSRRWSRVELEKWIAAGCPPRARWESLKP